ncbi:hypothetical protein GWY92_21160 [Salmonella enterica subsp. enterica]|nr:hypothetical protein [Salmonella enterica subsp. enterica serovar Oranienburg]
MNRIKVLAGKQVVLFWCSGRSGTSYIRQWNCWNCCDRQCKGDQQRSYKRMINLLIIVLRAAAALVNALIAILELIRQFID